MNRERLTILRDHLASLPDESVRMDLVREEKSCGTVACIAGWAEVIFPQAEPILGDRYDRGLGLTEDQCDHLFMPPSWSDEGRYSRQDAIFAIQSMLDNPDDKALPIWPVGEEV